MDSVRVVVRSLEGFTENLIKRLALNVTGNLIEDTPVDTGWAQANWVPQIGDARNTTVGSRQAAEIGQIDRGPQGAGKAAIARYRLGPQIHISNNVPYIKKLNAGSSTKAPSAFIQAAILRAVRDTVARTR